MGTPLLVNEEVMLWSVSTKEEFNRLSHEVLLIGDVGRIEIRLREVQDPKKYIRRVFPDGTQKRRLFKVTLEEIEWPSDKEFPKATTNEREL